MKQKQQKQQLMQDHRQQQPNDGQAGNLGLSLPGCVSDGLSVSQQQDSARVNVSQCASCGFHFLKAAQRVHSAQQLIEDFTSV